MADNPFKLSGNASGDNFSLDGWVNVEMPETERDRIDGKGLERVGDLSLPKEERPERAADSGSALDRMFAIAFRESDQAASAESLRRSLDVDPHGAMPEEFKKLEKSRLAACNAVHDLDSQTGKELVDVAVVVEQGQDWEAAADAQGGSKIERTRALLSDAIEAQENYAKELTACANQLESEGDTRRADALRLLAKRTQARAEAIAELPERLRAAYNSEDATAGDDELLLTRRGFTDLIYSKEAKDSGFRERLADAAADAPLDEDFYRDGGTDALSRAFSALRKTYGDADGEVDRKEVALAAARNLVDGVKLPADLLEKLEGIDGIWNNPKFKMKDFPESVQDIDFTALRKEVGRSFTRFKAAMNRYIEACADPEHSDLEAARKNLVKAVNNDDKTGMADCIGLVRKLRGEINKQFAQAVKRQRLGKGPVDPLLAEVAEKFRKLNLAFFPGGYAKELENLLKPGADASKFALTPADLSELMEGTRHLSSEVEAQIWGAKGLNDHGLDGYKLVSSRPLSAGTFNDVRLCTFKKEGSAEVEKRVFRPDSGASESIRLGEISYFLSTNKDTDGFVLNHAADVVASRLGCGDVFPKTTFGTLDGQPGMFLEYVGGEEGSYFAEKPGTGLAKSLFANRNDANVVAGEVARGLNRLQWLDFLTGQIDRHRNNIKIGTNEEGHVQVKGIDNDECFPDQSVGNGLLVYDSPQEAAKALARLGIPEKIAPEEMDFIRAKNLPQGLAKHLKGKFVVDINSKNFSLRNRLAVINCHKNFGMPDHIDKKLKEQLEGLNLDAYEQDLRQAGLTDKQVFAAMARLKYALATIKRMPEDRVYGENDWSDLNKLDAIDNDAESLALENEINDYNGDPGKGLISKSVKLATVHARKNYYSKLDFHRYLFGDAQAPAN